MATPAYIAHQMTVGASAWPSSISVSSAPSGSSGGDLLLAFVVQQWLSSGSLADPGLSISASGWTLVGSQSSRIDSTSKSAARMDVYSTTAPSWPFTATSTFTPTIGGGYRIHMVTYRPKKLITSFASDAIAQAPTSMPDSTVAVTVAAGGTAVAAAYLAAGSVGAFTTDNGFTGKVAQAGIGAGAGEGGGFRLADRSPSSAGSYNSPIWGKGGALGVTVLLSIDGTIAATAEWGVDRIAW